MLITEKGCNGRFGSLITSAKLKPSEKPDYEYCLYISIMVLANFALKNVKKKL
jgi:hypothetical protein